MNHPTFDNEEEFWSWWDEAVADKAGYVHPMAILQRARLSTAGLLDKKVFLTTREQAKVVEVAREMGYFNSPD